MEEPFLATEPADKPTAASDKLPKRLRGAGENEEVAALAIRCGCCTLISGIIFCIALSRNAGCSYDALRNIEPPFGGEIIPANSYLIEQQNWFQLTKVVDVYNADDDTHVGYFYDMQFLIFMRFGYSDAQDRIWFEAKYPDFMSRLFFAKHYQLERCDVGIGGRLGAIYDIREDWNARPWFCFSNCVRKFHVTRQPEGDSSQVTFPQNAVNVDFNSTLTWQGWQARHEWYMNMTNSNDGSVEAFAQQHFYWGGKLGWTMLSNWSVDVKVPTPAVPNWVVAFMAALDDISEDT